MKITSLLFALICGLGLQAQFFTLNGDGVDSSLWTISTGKLSPKNDIPFKSSFNGVELINDSIGGVVPFAGVIENLGSYSYSVGITDFSVIGGAKTLRVQALDLSTLTGFIFEADSMQAKISYLSSGVVDKAFFIIPDGIGVVGVDSFVNDAAVDTSSVPQHGLYLLNGDRTLYLKPNDN